MASERLNDLQRLLQRVETAIANIVAGRGSLVETQLAQQLDPDLQTLPGTHVVESPGAVVSALRRARSQIQDEIERILPGRGGSAEAKAAARRAGVAQTEAGAELRAGVEATAAALPSRIRGMLDEIESGEVLSAPEISAYRERVAGEEATLTLPGEESFQLRSDARRILEQIQSEIAGIIGGSERAEAAKTADRTQFEADRQKVWDRQDEEQRAALGRAQTAAEAAKLAKARSAFDQWVFEGVDTSFGTVAGKARLDDPVTRVDALAIFVSAWEQAHNQVLADYEIDLDYTVDQVLDMAETYTSIDFNTVMPEGRQSWRQAVAGEIDATVAERPVAAAVTAPVAVPGRFGAEASGQYGVQGGTPSPDAMTGMEMAAQARQPRPPQTGMQRGAVRTPTSMPSGGKENVAATAVNAGGRLRGGLETAVGSLAGAVRDGLLTAEEADELLRGLIGASESLIGVEELADLYKLVPGLAEAVSTGSMTTSQAFQYLGDLISLADSKRAEAVRVKETEEKERVRGAEREQDRRTQARLEIQGLGERRAAALGQTGVDEINAQRQFLNTLMQSQNLLPPIGAGSYIGGADIYRQVAQSIGAPAPGFAPVGVEHVSVPDYGAAFDEARRQIMEAYPQMTVEQLLA